MGNLADQVGRIGAKAPTALVGLRPEPASSLGHAATIALRDRIPAPHPQLIKLEALRAACDRGLLAASKGELFACTDGVRVINAAHDLFEVDALYDFAGDVCFELGLTRGDVS